MFDMLQLVGAIGKIQDPKHAKWLISSSKVTVPSLDDKLKHVAHQHVAHINAVMFDMLQLVAEIGKIQDRKHARLGIPIYARCCSQP